MAQATRLQTCFRNGPEMDPQVTPQGCMLAGGVWWCMCTYMYIHVYICTHVCAPPAGAPRSCVPLPARHGTAWQGRAGRWPLSLDSCHSCHSCRFRPAREPILPGMAGTGLQFYPFLLIPAIPASPGLQGSQSWPVQSRIPAKMRNSCPRLTLFYVSESQSEKSVKKTRDSMGIFTAAIKTCSCH